VTGKATSEDAQNTRFSLVFLRTDFRGACGDAAAPHSDDARPHGRRVHRAADGRTSHPADFRNPLSDSAPIFPLDKRPGQMQVQSCLSGEKGDLFRIGVSQFGSHAPAIAYKGSQSVQSQLAPLPSIWASSAARKPSRG